MFSSVKWECWYLFLATLRDFLKAEPKEAEPVKRFAMREKQYRCLYTFQT